MKRSEMIELIYNCLKDNHFGQYGEQYSECPENTWED